MLEKQTKQCFKSAINDLKPPHNQLNIINFPEISPLQSYNSNKNKHSSTMTYASIQINRLEIISEEIPRHIKASH